ncbi:cache domain-containing protein [Angustibacter peucedani]
MSASADLTTSGADVVRAVDDVGDRVHGLLDGLRTAVAEAFSGGVAPTREGLSIEDLAAAALRLPDLPLVGAGYVAAPGALSDVPYWLEWWTTDRDVPAPTVERLQVQTDPRADDFRDYTALAWFAGPRDDGMAHLTGPYVDYLCTDEYTLTFTQPVLVDDRFVGVVGADLHVRGLEASVLPTMERLTTPSTLVSATGRVVTSSGTGWVTGDLVRELPSADGELLRCTAVPLALLLPRQR